MPDTVYAIGDIHGQSAALDRALELIEADAGAGPVVFVGDYVDRGPDSRGVIERLMAGQQEGRNWVCLAGNHDRMFAEFLSGETGGTSRYPYLSDTIGGGPTLLSYGVDTTPETDIETCRKAAESAVPRAHRNWLDALPLTHRLDDYLFVHAGIRPGIPLDEQDDTDLIWIRDPFLNDTRDHGVLVVHGHTPEMLPTHHGNRVNLDGGAGFGRPLFPVVLEGRDAFLLDGFGRSRLEKLG